MTADDWISDLARLAEAATHGPWRADRWEDFTGREVTYSVSGDTEVSPTIHEHEDAEFIAAANPATILRLIEDLRRTKSGARTLGRVIEQQGRDVLDATGMHHVIGEDGDGDWAVVWEVLADQAVERRALAARLAAVEALLADGPDTWRPYQVREAGDVFMAESVLDFTADLRAVLSAAPTDTTKETP